MNPIIYQLRQARIIADSGTKGPVSFRFDSPALLVPSSDIVVRAADSVRRAGAGKFVLLRDSETEWTIEAEGEAGFGPLHVVQFESYRQTEQAEDRLVYRIWRDSLPPGGSVMEFPRQAMPLLLHLIEETRLAVSLQAAPRLNLLLDELMHSVLVVNIYSAIFPTKDPAIEQAIAHIHLHYGASLTRSSMAELCGFNPSYFSSLFRKETGWGFNEYLNRIRLDEAKRLLLGTEDTLQDIALKTGFSDGAYLAKSFKKAVGLSASEFRRGRRPERVAAMQFIGAALALGVKPVAVVRDTHRVSALLWEDLCGTAVMEELHSIETLKPQQPEVIVAPTYFYNFPETLRELEKIAPVLMLDWGAMDKLEEVRALGRLLGRTGEAESWIAAIRLKAERARRAISAFVKPHETAAIYELSYNDSWLIPYRTVRSAYGLYELLGMTPPERVREEGTARGKHLFVQEPELPAYAASHMFVIVPDDDTEAARVKLMSRGVWQRFYREGRAIHLIRLKDFWMDDGVSLDRQLDILANFLAEGQRLSSDPTIFPVG
ncbi:helix-turn-helix domain-containing protein [Cohnella fermenti]|uniref:Helix-turn-helix domain-containing protein n=1 Tax=Cohnella fermenti TaxID=2565925 RepID=A0A4S4C6Q9_9BACL|nr:helix-turn-helix domain-containing protein [Cohnella fermenti]THF83288.1 helix-turn-helix domain-containing protein [Cohnella fermenti]